MFLFVESLLVEGLKQVENIFWRTMSSGCYNPKFVGYGNINFGVP
jgi:hypothetical protein